MQAANNPTQEVNILLLGETGVGKSTFINAFANYVTYDTLEEAMGNEMKVVIPSHFTMTNDNYESIKVSVGETDDNEDATAGQSATQHPITHTFRTNGTVFRIIDTPGIGDTRGIEQDKENFQNIMNHLSDVKQLHGICILLKPNSARISISFEFCIKELLTQLHKDAANNVAFCFTNARSTFYRPGDTLETLRALLKNAFTGQSLIPLERKTIYCLDNEAFRFLAAIKHGETFGKSEQENFSNSWKTSVMETERMIQYFRTIQPHDPKSTVTLNATRQIIVKLAKPLAEVTHQVQLNIALLDDKTKELRNLSSRGGDLKGKMKIPQVDLQTVELDYPKTVCAAPECTEKISMHSTSEEKPIFKTNYKQVCHDHCHLKGVATEEVNCSALQRCSAMTNGVCNHCEHEWEKHMHITYDIKQVMVDVVDKNVKSDLETTEERKKAVESVISQCQERKKKYEREQDVITKTAAKFAVFLKKNSITPYNNAIIRYLDYMIKLEEEKVNLGGMKTTVEELKKLRQVYVAEETVLLQAMQSSQDNNISLDQIHQSLQALYDLPLTGGTIRNLLKTATGAEKRTHEERTYTTNKNRFR